MSALFLILNSYKGIWSHFSAMLIHTSLAYLDDNGFTYNNTRKASTH